MDNEFLNQCHAVVITAETHLIDAFGEAEGLQAFQAFVSILTHTREYWSYQKDKAKTLKQLPEVFRALANSFEILNDVYNKEGK